jgi:hypothetical protein
MKLLLLLASLIFIAQPANAQSTPYSFEKWPQDIAKIPCDTWKRSPDGSAWIQVQTLTDISSTPAKGGIKGYDTYGPESAEFSLIQKHCLPIAPK